MQKPENSISTKRTSAGLPVNQSFSPPIGKSFRSSSAPSPQRDIFQTIEGDKKTPKLPSSATINKPLAEVAAKIRDLRNFAVFFEGLENVESLNPKLSRWHFKESTSAISMKSEDKDNFVLWRSEDALGFPFTLAIYLEPAQANRGTVVRLLTSYESTSGEVAGLVEKVFGKDASVAGKKILQRIKAFCETGHIPTTEGQPHGSDDDSKILSTESSKSNLSPELSH